MIASTPPQKTVATTWQPATWEDYERYRDRLPITLLEQALNRLTYDTNITAAQWFMQALVKPSETRISA